MSRLDELIQELCPDGVEYKRIDEICDISRGRVMSKDYIQANQGEYPVYSSQTENDGELGKISSFDYEGEYLTWTTDGANAGSVFYRNGRFSITNVCGLLKVNKDDVITRYIYHSLQIEAPKYVNKGMGNPKLMSNVMARIKLPVPPLEVQREIVRILDNFTSLKAELQARKKQYEYYRDQLLSFDSVHGGGTDECEWRTLWEVFDIRNGYTPSKSNDEFWKNGTIPWFRMEDIRKNGRILSDSIQKVALQAVKGELFPADSIIVATSATIGEHALIKCKSLANQRFTYLVLKDEYKDKFNIKFLFYYCYKLDEYCLKCLNQSNFASVDMSKFRNFKFPIISLGTQERIVEVLDNFDAICSDLNIGLPAEIEARQKQYEYYRDALLSFDNSYFVNVEREREREREMSGTAD